MLNLLQNSVHHSPKGCAVSVDISPNGSQVCVRVVDSGAGIPEADQSRIFDRFVQLDPSRRAEGTGLGLTIAKWIADVHQGSLNLESCGAAGSRFCVVLPVSH
jgi:signal transduction histidine kinase